MWECEQGVLALMTIKLKRSNSFAEAGHDFRWAVYKATPWIDLLEKKRNSIFLIKTIRIVFSYIFQSFFKPWAVVSLTNTHLLCIFTIFLLSGCRWYAKIVRKFLMVRELKKFGKHCYTWTINIIKTQLLEHIIKKVLKQRKTRNGALRIFAVDFLNNVL